MKKFRRDEYPVQSGKSFCGHDQLGESSNHTPDHHLFNLLNRCCHMASLLRGAREPFIMGPTHQTIHASLPPKSPRSELEPHGEPIRKLPHKGQTYLRDVYRSLISTRS